MGHRLAVGFILAHLSCAGCAGSLRLPARTDDPGIESLIARRLSADQRLCAFDVTVAVRGGGTARLEGKVSSDADRRRAEKLARDAGAARVDDQLVVDPAAGDAAKC